MDLEARQVAIEKEYTAAGIRDALVHWQKEIAEGRMADTGIGRTLAVRLYSVVKAALDDRLSRKTRGVGGKYNELVREVGTDLCAVICIRVALGLIGHNRRTGNKSEFEPLAQEYIQLAGSDAEVEHMFHKLTLAAPGYMHRVESSLADTNTRSKSHRRRTFTASANNVGLSTADVVWSNQESTGVGRILLETAVSTGIIVLGKQPKTRGHEWVVVRLAPEIVDRIDSLVSTMRAFTKYPPMLTPPKLHTTETLYAGASYLTDGMAKTCGTIRLRSRRGDHRKWIRNNISDTVLNAANIAAHQGYVVDTETLSILRDLFAQGNVQGICGIPSATPVVVPEYPMERGWDQEDPTMQDIHGAWKARAKAAYSAERERKSHAVAFSQTMKYLREYSGDTLYFPTYYDWRGRLYFRSRINPQSTDVVKAALQFANKKALGKRGVYWLKAHIATCYGFDKKNFDARVLWTDSNMREIQDAVDNHIDSEFFRGADSPWCFFVAARELLRALATGNPEAWETGIPVAMDATCSGMQHLSAVLRDPVGGMFTNLLPNNGEEKEDIYAGVAAVAIANIQKDKDNIEQAQYWMHSGVPRSMAKRPVMTYVYGGTLQSCTEYVYLDMVERGLTAIENYSEFKLAAYLSRQLRKGIESAVPASAECMRFLRELAASMPKDTAMSWVTPAGFPVVQHYAQEEITRISMPGLGATLTMCRFNDDLLNRAKCINGISPNFTHSLDSAHLVKVIEAFNGSIVPIHDSFATHPSDVDAMHIVLRDEFVNLYVQHDPLQTLVDLVQSYTEDEIVVPKKGSLDIQQVKKSTFFMC